MRQVPPTPARAWALKREPPSLGAQGDRGFTPRGGVERPASLREAIIRWLNEEL